MIFLSDKDAFVSVYSNFYFVFKCCRVQTTELFVSGAVIMDG